jgi:hypothetical protein
MKPLLFNAEYDLALWYVYNSYCKFITLLNCYIRNVYRGIVDYRAVQRTAISAINYSLSIVSCLAWKNVHEDAYSGCLQ